MKCPHCGAEIRRGQRVCEYCDSEIDMDLHVDIIDTPPREQDSVDADYGTQSETLKTTGRVIYKVFLVIVPTALTILFITFMFFINSGVISGNGNTDNYSAKQNSLPKNQEHLTGTVKSYDGEGIVSFNYNGTTYDNIKILDKELIDWLNETDRTLERTDILFDTDENCNIKEIAMHSEIFIVLSKDSQSYTACRGNQIVQFTSEVPLEMNVPYTGYFSYPSLHLVSAQEDSLLPNLYMDAVCGEKQIVVEKDPYTEADISVCKILSGGQWYYCSNDIYDTLTEGDVMSDYKFYYIPSPVITQ